MYEQWRSRITIEPGKRGGRPCIRGMRITVYDVLSYLAAGMTVRGILEDFPYLTPEDIQACFAFAAVRNDLDHNGDTFWFSPEELSWLLSSLVGGF
jgi:uncharacterized protein (DUF433 family)